MRQDIIFGSTSDEKLVLPGIVKATANIKDLEVRVFYASADNTPEKVDRIMKEASSQEGRTVYISGAGMSNVLTGVVKRYANVEDLVIGVPIGDKMPGILSSFLSTSEKPPRNPVLTVGLNNTYAALNIAYRVRKGFESGQEPVVLDDGRVSQQGENPLKKAFDEIKMRYAPKTLAEIKPDDVVVNVFDFNMSYGVSMLNEVDRILRKGNGVQVGVNTGGITSDPSLYVYCLEGANVTGIVSIDGYVNAAQVAAQILGKEDAFRIIKDKKKKKSEELESHSGMIVADGKVNPCGGA